jgi:SOS-response transcriptional repressor LexA
MSYSITTRQREYLDFLRQYIAKNESSPSLNEVATHFRVKPPTAHKTLEALQKKGYLYFRRSKWSGFYIRLLERAGSSEIVTEVAILGKFNKYGEIFEFPKLLGHFASLLTGANPDQIFSLLAIEHMPEAGILVGDLIIFDIGKKPKPDDICIIAIGTKMHLIRVASKTYDRDLETPESAQEYPIPNGLIEDRGQKLNWYPLAYNNETNDYFVKVTEEENFNIRALSSEQILGTALRLTRALSF